MGQRKRQQKEQRHMVKRRTPNRRTLRWAIDAQGHSLKEAGMALGVDTSTVSRWLLGKCRPSGEAHASSLWEYVRIAELRANRAAPGNNGDGPVTGNALRRARFGWGHSLAEAALNFGVTEEEYLAWESGSLPDSAEEKDDVRAYILGARGSGRRGNNAG